MMGMGIDPRQLAAVQEVSKDIKAVIRADYKENTVQFSLSSEAPEAQALIPNLLEQFTSALAQQLSSMFAIKGEIVEVGRPGVKEG